MIFKMLLILCAPSTQNNNFRTCIRALLTVQCEIYLELLVPLLQILCTYVFFCNLSCCGGRLFGCTYVKVFTDMEKKERRLSFQR